ncbi:CDGSH iron-sulfur domain-containing protein 2 homolog [Belonocnema kinseyi]|uniref:CDGSH iron-sulfur domain-containing protein 2 homolog n=1 Tax=Belonocnema kinseyi TaxID=2817044 RepID=UPI00143DBB66|nr:CDGSH iron-sulfur domain-containing protein 2 homolog [Belonocnema kinseyi]
MEPVAHLIKVSIPNYLSGLPIPDSIGGWFRLGVRDWLSLIPPSAMLAGLGYMSYRAFCPLARPFSMGILPVFYVKYFTHAFYVKNLQLRVTSHS